MQHPTTPLHQRAWHTAHRVAEMLYTRFGASQVAVFGSLTQPNAFSKNSDIDIAVSGLTADRYLTAVAETTEFSPEFRVELINFEACKGRFRHRIQHEAVPLKKTENPAPDTPFIREAPKNGKETEAVNRNRLYRLRERISEEHSKIAERVEKIDADLQKLEQAPVEYREGLEILIARHLYDFYKGLENIFKRIAQNIDGSLPQSETWHKTLLQQMSEPSDSRPPLLSAETCRELRILLGFRHVFLYIYAEELDYEQTLENAKRVTTVFPQISEELDTFIASLK